MRWIESYRKILQPEHRPPFAVYLYFVCILRTSFLDMSQADKTELVANFTSVTGVDTERARFYLEAAAWKLDVRIDKDEAPNQVVYMGDN